MSAKTHYSGYVSDKNLIESYSAYQDKYKSEPRESDKVVLDELARRFAGVRGASILDVGCSTGNFLRHLRPLLPEAQLVGSDLAAAAVEKCRSDLTLAGIDFRVADALDLSGLGQFDAISSMAVGFLFDWQDYDRYLRSVAGALRPGGTYYAFELIHPFSVQDLTIVETSQWNPDGLTLRFRPMRKVEEVVRGAGFESVSFRPFSLPIDLPFPGYDADVVTYTRKDENGERMAFRGALYQPWCHLLAQKPADAPAAAGAE